MPARYVIVGPRPTSHPNDASLRSRTALPGVHPSIAQQLGFASSMSQGLGCLEVLDYRSVVRVQGHFTAKTYVATIIGSTDVKRKRGLSSWCQYDVLCSENGLCRCELSSRVKRILSVAVQVARISFIKFERVTTLVDFPVHELKVFALD